MFAKEETGITREDKINLKEEQTSKRFILFLPP
jgi:hypothetical protein